MYNTNYVGTGSKRALAGPVYSREKAIDGIRQAYDIGAGIYGAYQVGRRMYPAVRAGMQAAGLL